MPVIDLSAAASDISGTSPQSFYVNAADYGLTHALTGDAQASTNVTALAAWSAAITAARAAKTAGVVGVIPPGRYIVNDACTLPDLAAGQPLTIHAEGARFRFAAGTTNKTMFKTGIPTDSTDAEAKNDLRDLWRWYGGSFYGLNGAGTRAFEWNAVSRLLQDGLFISGFEEGIRARFALHYRLQNSSFSACDQYGVRIEEQGDWTGGTASNSASNGTIIDNVRFYGQPGQAAQLRIAHSGHVIKDCTFEGSNPVVNIDIDNGNTSVLHSEAVNLHMENNPTEAHVKLDAYHGYKVDFQYINSDSVYVKAVSGSCIEVGRAGWPAMGSTFTGFPRFETPNPIGDLVWVFRNTGHGGEIDPTNTECWVDGRLPAGLYADGVFEDKKARVVLTTTDHLDVVAGALRLNGTPI